MRKDDELDIKEAIDNQFTSMPYYGIVRMTQHLRNKGFTVNKKPISDKLLSSRACFLFGFSE
jgi:hypothetical protein